MAMFPTGPRYRHTHALATPTHALTSQPMHDDGTAEPQQIGRTDLHFQLQSLEERLPSAHKILCMCTVQQAVGRPSLEKMCVDVCTARAVHSCHHQCTAGFNRAPACIRCWEWRGFLLTLRNDRPTARATPLTMEVKLKEGAEKTAKKGENTHTQ